LSEILLCLHSEYIIKEALELIGGFKIGGKVIFMEMYVEEAAVMRILRHPSTVKNMIDQKQPENMDYLNSLGNMMYTGN